MKARITILIILIVLTISGFPSQIFAAGYPSYSYSFKNSEAVPCPAPYFTRQIITGKSIGSTDFNKPEDIFIDSSKNIYILDTGNNRIVVIHLDNKVSIIDKFDNNGSLDSLNNPKGIYVNAAGDIYIADTGNMRIVVLDKNKELKSIVKEPKSEFLAKDYVFKPLKIVADKASRMYVIAEGVYNGLMEFDLVGNFIGFSGANKVRPAPFELIWRRFSTKAQIGALFIPTEFSNLDLDKSGFIYTTTATIENEYAPALSEPVRRQSTSGDNIVKYSALGFGYPIGDIGYPFTSEADISIRGPSRFIDVSVWDNGVYSCIDTTRGRVFTYDFDGNLLFVFGGLGDIEGMFKQPTAIANSGGNIYVLDKSMAQITVFEPSYFGTLVFDAENLHYSGKYTEAAQKWDEVLKINSNYELAYIGEGKALLRENRFFEAMKNFRLGEDRYNYSKAYKLYREEEMGKNIGYIVLGIIGIIILLLILKKYLWPKIPKGKLDRFLTWKALKYTFHVIFRPFDGFWDLKREKRGNVTAATTILAFVWITFIVQKQVTGFIFNRNNLDDLNIFAELARIAVPVAVWCIANWCVTTLMDGEGTFKDIYISTAYSLVPFVIINIPLAIISNVFVYEETMVIVLFQTISIIWVGFLLFAAMLTIHQYTAKQAIGAIIFTCVGMGIIVFISILFFNLIQQLIMFLYSIYGEITFRI